MQSYLTLAGTLFSNPLILLGIAVEVTLSLLIDYTPWGTAPIPLTAWMFALSLCAGYVWCWKRSVNGSCAASLTADTIMSKHTP